MPKPNLPPQKGERQTPENRINNFDEVAQGLTKEQALQEASRCLNCKNPTCQGACPVNVRIPQFISALLENDVKKAISKIRETSLFPAICGRVCPQEKYCQGACILKEKFGAVSIGLLERYTADVARKENLNELPIIEKETGFKVACIGSGPSSLACAVELRRQGHSVTIFEALHSFGGVLSYGIPPFRLPREVVKSEIKMLENMGVVFEPNTLIGASLSIKDLLKTFDAVFVGSGAGLPMMAGVKNENAVGVYSANEFLTRLNLMGAYDFPKTDTPIKIGKKVLVLGGGNSAMDAARSARRLGADVTIVYRRSRAEMPARAEEIENAEEEGIKFSFLTLQKEVLIDDKSHACGLLCTRAELGEPDEKGRRKPIEIKGSEFTLQADSIIVAIGQKPNPIIARTTPELKTTMRGTLELDDTEQTTIKGVFAGGDIKRGGATVLLAMKDGISAASQIKNYLANKKAKGGK